MAAIQIEIPVEVEIFVPAQADAVFPLGVYLFRKCLYKFGGCGVYGLKP
jgi:hypothetical protein